MKPAIAWTLRLIPAIIIGQTLPFKFGGAEASVELFSDLAYKALGNAGLEGALRIGTGVFELIAVILLLIPKQSLKGALLVAGTMFGALSSHALFIGFAAYAPLPILAFIALAASVTYIIANKEEIVAMGEGKLLA